MTVKRGTVEIGDEEVTLSLINGTSDVLNAPPPQALDPQTLDADDVQIPRLTLVQAMSDAARGKLAAEGEWYIAGVGSLPENFSMVPIGVAKSRERAVGQGKARQVVCRSGDGETGYGVPGGECHGCPYAAFGKDEATGKVLAPGCNMQYNYMVYIAEIGQVAMWRAQKTAIGAAKMINSQLLARGEAAFILTMGRQAKTNDLGTFYVPTVFLARGLSEEIAASILDEARAYRAMYAPAMSTATSALSVEEENA